VRIRILGTRGEIEEYSKFHKKHSGILIDNLLFDIGEKEYLKYNPKTIFITHLHPDHAYFVEDKEELDIDIPIYAPEKFNDITQKMDNPIKIGKYRIIPIPTAHSKKVKSQGYLIVSDKTRIFYSGDMMWILKKYYDKIRDVDLVITEGSSYDRSLIRKDPKTGERYGHKSIKDLVSFFKRLGAKKIVITHYGKWKTDNPKEGDKKIKQLGNDIKVLPAKDNMEIVLSTLQLKPEDVKAITPKEIATIKTGLYLVEPHGELIWKGDKTLIVKSKKFTKHIKEEMYLLSGKYCYGIIYLEEPKEITKEEFDKLVDRHKITQEEYEEWGWKEPLYAYEFRFRKYDEPVPVRLPKGIQIFVSAKDIKFLTPESMSDRELLLYHILSHIYNAGCTHHKIVHELENRGYPHAIRELIDRKYELIRDIEKYDPKKPNDRQLGDDWRICLAWWSRLLQGKPFKYTKQQVYNVAKKILLEMIKRGFTFNRPETYKQGARDLFVKLIKNIGKEKIPWKEELFELPKGMRIEDIDVEYVVGLDDTTLKQLHSWLHKQYEKYGISEPLYNAHIFVGIELLKRGIEDHKEAKDKLDEETQLEIVEYPTPKGLEEPIEEREPEGEYIFLEDVLSNFPKHIVVGGQPYAAYLTGRIVNEGKIPKDHDIDIVFRQEPDPRIPIALRLAKPKWLTNRLHYVPDPTGPLIGYSIPIVRYGFYKVRREDMIKGFGPYRKIELAVREVKPFMKFRALKAKAGWQKYEFWKFQDLWDIWASKNLDRGLIIQKKYDGRRFIIHKQGDKVQIVTEDRQRDRSNQLPNIVKELQTIKHDFVIDTEAVGYDCKGKLVKSARLKEDTCEEIPREDTAELSGNEELTVGAISPEQEQGYVFHIHDLLYLDGKSLNSSAYSERFGKLRTIFPDKYQFLRVVQSSPITYTPRQFKQWVQKLRTVKGSEGVMVKTADSIYPIRIEKENRTPDWAKLKNLKSIDVIVHKVVPKREAKTGKIIPGQYMYDCAIAISKEDIKDWDPKELVEINGKIYADIGRTFATGVKCKIGDIIEVLVGRIREYIDKKTGKHKITWMFPKFREKRIEKKEPDTLETARRLAKVGPEAIANLYERVITVKFKLCPYYQSKRICPLRIKFAKPRHMLSIIRMEYLKYPIACPLASYFKCKYIKGYYYGFKEYRRRELY